MTETTPTVAMIGLGAMGLPMATRLAEDLTVRAFDVFDARIDLAVKAGATAAGTVADAITDADVVVVSVRDLSQFESAFYGDHPAVDRLGAGSIIIMTSTIGTDAVRAAAARLAERDVALLDAPVSGGPVRAGKGDLLIMVGAEQTVIDRAAPVLDRLASTVYVVGPNPGDGQTMKTVNQLLCGIHTAAAAEALALAHSLGMDLERALDVLGRGAAASFMLADRGPRMIERLRGESPELRSRLDVIDKDMGLVHELARSSGLSTPVAAAAEQVYLGLLSRGFAAEDDSIAVRSGAPE